MNRSQQWTIIVIAGVIAAALVAIVVVLAARSDGDSVAAPASSTSSSTSIPSTTTSSATSSTTTSTSMATSSTTTTAPSTTTSSTSSSTTSTSSSTTTTLPAGVVLAADGFGGVSFGASPDETIAYVTTALGPPTEDSGWIDAFSIYGACPLPVVRGVHWGALIALFTRAGTEFAAQDVEHFFSYYYTSNLAPAVGLGTAENIFLGSTRADLDAAYGGSLIVVDDEFGTFWRAQAAGMVQLYGFLSGTLPGDLVESINGGIGCGE